MNTERKEPLTNRLIAPPSIDSRTVCAAIVDFMGICAVCCFVYVAGF